MHVQDKLDEETNKNKLNGQKSDGTAEMEGKQNQNFRSTDFGI